jgi:hypothetical protein
MTSSDDQRGEIAGNFGVSGVDYVDLGDAMLSGGELEGMSSEADQARVGVDLWRENVAKMRGGFAAAVLAVAGVFGTGCGAAEKLRPAFAQDSKVSGKPALLHLDKAPVVSLQMGIGLSGPLNGDAILTVPEKYGHPELIPSQYEDTYTPGDKSYSISTGCISGPKLRLSFFSMAGVGLRLRSCGNDDDYHTIWGDYGEGNYAFIGEPTTTTTTTISGFIPSLEFFVRTPLLPLDDKEIIFLQMEYSYLHGVDFKQGWASGYDRYGEAYSEVVDANVDIGDWHVSPSHFFGPVVTMGGPLTAVGGERFYLFVSGSLAMGFNSVSFTGVEGVKVDYNSTQLLLDGSIDIGVGF